jgi:putative oligomerization/nucleic acid binding protein
MESGPGHVLPVALAGLATKTKAAAFVIFADGKYHETALNGNAAVRAAQAEAIKFNLMAGTAAPPAQQQDDVAAILRKLASLHDEGLLTDEEFAAKRAEIIARL